MLEPSVRQLCAFAVIALFFVFFLSTGLSYHFDDEVRILSGSSGFPDFSQYAALQTLSPAEFPIDDPTRRTIIVGDIHGSYRYLSALLKRVDYNSSSDVLIHVGDILTKGGHNSSMDTLEFMTTHNITGVRGNHDQKVIEWRGWLAWIRTQPGGSRWLTQTQARWSAATDEGENDLDPEKWLKDEINKHKEYRKWWKRIPSGWKLFGDHFLVAQDMSEQQAAYLRALPLALHIPSAHAFVVHAGLLPSDPKYKPTHPRQPLARVPKLPKGKGNAANENDKNQVLRTLQELAILADVPQNTVPYNVLNIRSIVDNEVTKDKVGKPWSKAWKHDMLRCAGFDKDPLTPPTSAKPAQELLPCYPATVIYGHAASRGLDIKRWSIGLDSGCVYNRRLSALVLGSKGVEVDGEDGVEIDNEDDDEKDRQEHDASHGNAEEDADEETSSRKNKNNESRVRFGDAHWGHIVSVSCS